MSVGVLSGPVEVMWAQDSSLILTATVCSSHRDTDGERDSCGSEMDVNIWRLGVGGSEPVYSLRISSRWHINFLPSEYLSLLMHNGDGNPMVLSLQEDIHMRVCRIDCVDSDQYMIENVHEQKLDYATDTSQTKSAYIDTSRVRGETFTESSGAVVCMVCQSSLINSCSDVFVVNRFSKSSFRLLKLDSIVNRVLHSIDISPAEEDEMSSLSHYMDLNFDQSQLLVCSSSNDSEVSSKNILRIVSTADMSILMIMTPPVLAPISGCCVLQPTVGVSTSFHTCIVLSCSGTNGGLHELRWADHEHEKMNTDDVEGGEREHLKVEVDVKSLYKGSVSCISASSRYATLCALTTPDCDASTSTCVVFAPQLPISDYPGPMYPPGYVVLNAAVSYDEAEDEFDIPIETIFSGLGDRSSNGRQRGQRHAQDIDVCSLTPLVGELTEILHGSADSTLECDTLHRDLIHEQKMCSDMEFRRKWSSSGGWTPERRILTDVAEEALSNALTVSPSGNQENSTGFSQANVLPPKVASGELARELDIAEEDSMKIRTLLGNRERVEATLMKIKEVDDERKRVMAEKRETKKRRREQLEKETQQTDMQQTAGSSQAVYPDMPPPSIPSTATVEPQVSVSTSGPPLETEGVTGTVGVDGNTERVPIVKE